MKYRSLFWSLQLLKLTLVCPELHRQSHSQSKISIKLSRRATSGTTAFAAAALQQWLFSSRLVNIIIFIVVSVYRKNWYC